MKYLYVVALNKYGGTICFTCSQEEQPDSCRQIRLCASGQVSA